MCLSLYMTSTVLPSNSSTNAYLSNSVLCAGIAHIYVLWKHPAIIPIGGHFKYCFLFVTLLTLPLCIHFIIFHVQCCKRVLIFGYVNN